ncbi:MAG: hypothetical protein O2954_06810 [bacterium]|nr:hypothetical protein [bacterium]
MEAQADFKELLTLFNAHNVAYVIVGAYALSYHGSPRYTGDLDILIRPDSENAQRILNALADFGFGNLGLTSADFTTPDNVIQLGYPPVRIDLVTSITGVPWEEVDRHKEADTYGDVETFYIGRSQLIKNKRLTGRKKDLADLESLGEE